jgi:hypothetical protein
MRKYKLGKTLSRSLTNTHFLDDKTQLVGYSYLEPCTISIKACFRMYVV